MRLFRVSDLVNDIKNKYYAAKKKTRNSQHLHMCKDASQIGEKEERSCESQNFPIGYILCKWYCPPSPISPQFSNLLFLI